MKPTKKPDRASLIRDCDKLWSELVRERDGGRCRFPGCGYSPAYPHHVFSRRSLATRWEVRNGFTLCFGHHRRGHAQDPEELRDVIISQIGQEEFDRIKFASRAITKLGVADLWSIKEGLTRALIEMRAGKEQRE